VALGVLLASLLASQAASWWLGELLVNFRVQYLALAALALAPLLAGRDFIFTGCAAAGLALNAVPVMDYLRPAALPATSVQRPAALTLRVASINVFFMNRAHGKVVSWVRRMRPEVVAFMEVTPEWRRGLAPLDAEYPYREFATDLGHHAVLLLSRWPLSSRSGPPGDLQQRPAIFVTVTKDGMPLRFAALHAMWPMTPWFAAQRGADFAAVAAEARQRGRLPFVAVGDLNVSPLSPRFAVLLAESGLRSAAAGLGWMPTWPAFFPPFGIQLDHALVSPQIAVRQFVRGSGTGSDHRPILVDLAFAAPIGHLGPRSPSNSVTSLTEDSR
jgi:endonuclease/exonuclease/phosphatase (EEP) superfamily protein YafD